MRNNAARTVAGAAALPLLLLLVACGGPTDQGASEGRGTPVDPSTPSSSSGAHTMADGSTMSDAEMEAMGSGEETSGKTSGEASGEASGEPADAETTPASGDVTHWGDGPSAAAAMICSLEIAGAVQGALDLPQTPSATDAWSEETYTCTYALPSGSVRLSVEDVDAAAPGRAAFGAVSDRLQGARAIRGLQNMGFPAVRTPGPVGSVAFLKDHKTLWVDASDVAANDLRAGFTRTDTAYNVASHVISCWTE